MYNRNSIIGLIDRRKFTLKYFSEFVPRSWSPLPLRRLFDWSFFNSPCFKISVSSVYSLGGCAVRSILGMIMRLYSFLRCGITRCDNRESISNFGIDSVWLPHPPQYWDDETFLISSEKVVHARAQGKLTPYLFGTSRLLSSMYMYVRRTLSQSMIRINQHVINSISRATLT